MDHIFEGNVFNNDVLNVDKKYVERVGKDTIKLKSDENLMFKKNKFFNKEMNIGDMKSTQKETTKENDVK